MRKILFIIYVLLIALPARSNNINLSGLWHFSIDKEERGIEEQWFNRVLGDSILLPGTMLSNGKGEVVDINTQWTGGIADSSFFYSDRYLKYRQHDNFKVPFWLQPEKHYVGVAWYQRKVKIPMSWTGKDIELFLERCHWETRLWIDNHFIGTKNSLGTPHRYKLPSFLTPGYHTLTIRVDNKIRDIDPGENAHSISDHTQGNWNGIVGALRLEAKSPIHWEYIKIFPSFKERTLSVKASIENNTLHPCQIMVKYECCGKRYKRIITLETGSTVFTNLLPLPNEVETWDEFHPNLYSLTYKIIQKGQVLDTRTERFGCREWTTSNGILKLNGHPVFMRGTLHCAAFPLTGYPAMNREEWKREFHICKNYGINHIRFHSWCPPEAAFEVADEMGFYLMIECSSWPNQSSAIGLGNPVDSFVMEESRRIVRTYGNHPSFCMLNFGNEPRRNGEPYLKYSRDFVNYWKSHDNRRLYTAAAGRPNIPENDFLSDPLPRIQQMEQQLNSIINSQEPSTSYDWRNYIAQYPNQPLISHEIGQWCAYPNLKEIDKYKGVYKAKNFEIFRETLQEAGLYHLADSFLLASGKLQTLCYKADIEAALRTPRLGGFELLGLNDFPGQGTALVGSLDVFWEEKGYVTSKEYTHFCNALVPLAKMEKLIYKNNEKLRAQIEVANFFAPLTNTTIKWQITNSKKAIVKQGEFPAQDIPLGNGQVLGNLSIDLSFARKATQYTLKVTVDKYTNNWNFWVYPYKNKTLAKNEVIMTDTIDEKTKKILINGGKVLLSLRKNSLSEELGRNIKIGFSSIFWNTAWTHGMAPHTLGILCNPKHPIFTYFPTEYYSDFQWWDNITHSNAINIGLFNSKIKPLVRVIDDWFTNRSLALLFEAKVGKGSILVSGIDFYQKIDKLLSSKQLLWSIKQYMNSKAFNPQNTITIEEIQKL